jgi:hypothetical protein
LRKILGALSRDQDQGVSEASSTGRSSASSSGVFSTNALSPPAA